MDEQQQEPQVTGEPFVGATAAPVASASGLKGMLQSAWRGQEKLWKVFWLYGVVGGIILQIIISILGSIFAPLAIVGLVLMLVFGVWNWVSIWRCAWNAGAKFWGILARVVVVLSVIGYVMSIITVVGLLFAASAMKASVENNPVPMSAPMAPASAPAAPVDATAPAPMAPAADPMAAAPAAPVAPAPMGDPMAPAPASAPGVAPVAPAAPMAAPAAPVAAPVAPVAAPAAAMDACEQRMADYAKQNGADPAAYIAANQAYLAQCRQQTTPKP